MDRMIYDVTVKCPPDFKKKGIMERHYHASIEKEEKYHLFTFEESYRVMDRDRFIPREGFTLSTSIGNFLVIHARKKDEANEIHPNPMLCYAVRTA